MISLFLFPLNVKANNRKEKSYAIYMYIPIFSRESLFNFSSHRVSKHFLKDVQFDLRK